VALTMIMHITEPLIFVGVIALCFIAKQDDRAASVPHSSACPLFGIKACSRASSKSSSALLGRQGRLVSQRR